MGIIIITIATDTAICFLWLNSHVSWKAFFCFFMFAHMSAIRYRYTVSVMMGESIAGVVISMSRIITKVNIWYHQNFFKTYAYISCHILDHPLEKAQTVSENQPLCFFILLLHALWCSYFIKISCVLLVTICCSVAAYSWTSFPFVATMFDTIQGDHMPKYDTSWHSTWLC